MVFESVKKERLAKAWNFFLFEKETENAKCLLCQQVLKARGSSTKSLNDHDPVQLKLNVFFQLQEVLLPKSGQNLEMTA